ncbi:sensor histidine kinase [Gimesia chilikensis]|uniref:histidine kinase n=1 Tax=Gimesia chilikensis TaxID=2605989 RepID=A0A517PM09_9PLAN|nr:HAMP domain-containing sensor histidine kinase [Gimesia chilikensis]QDT20405.1 Sporulation kinase A [Gimesia chilikensis]QDT85193.1 Sporulation kinase A [Gimesia chilikensis]
MFFTQTIRRKLGVGLGIIFFMLILLAYGAVSGLLSYQNTVADFKYSLDSLPDRDRLIVSVVSLNEPLQKIRHSRPAASAHYQQKFKEQLQDVKDNEIPGFLQKVDRLPDPSLSTWRGFVNSQFSQHSAVMKRLDHLSLMAEQLEDPKQRLKVAEQMILEVAHLESLILEVKEVPSSMKSVIERASRVYRSRYNLVWVTCLIVFITFGCLIWYGYKTVLAPIQELHSGARIVAQGHFDHHFEIKSRDEMAELAEAFNKMTQRFKEKRDELNHKVDERSRQLVRSERLAGIGVLAAGVAHEINNPLSAISMASESLQGRMGDLKPHCPEDDLDVVEQYLGLIQREAMRCRDITSKLLDFSRGQNSVRSENDLVAVIEEVCSMVSLIKRLKGRNIQFSPPGACWAEFNPAEIKQVVLNIMTNALESMEVGGSLEIQVREHVDSVTLIFKDDGCGMSPEVMDSLFDPFFTQRADGTGTGLGMSITHRIVKDHGGEIEVESAGPGKGSTFFVELPKKAKLQSKAA